MAEIYDFYVHDNRKITFNLTEPIMREDSGVTDFVFHIPKVLNELEVSDWAWWLVFVNANKAKYSIALTLSDDPERPLEFNTATYTVDYAMSIKAGSVQFALEAINAGTGGAIDNEWHTLTYETKVKETLQGNQAEYAETESDIISALLEEVRTKMNQVIGGATPAPVASVSAMTDPSKLYLLTTDGEWYYHNGTQFVHGGVYGAGVVDSVPTQGSTNAVSSGGVYSALQNINVSTDTTLSVSGKPADAKAVGDALAEKVDTVSGKGLSTNDYSDAEKQKVTDATAELSAITTATASDVGKTLKAKAVENEKVIEWEFGEVDTSELEEKIDAIQSEITQNINSQSIWQSGKIAAGTSGGAIKSDTKNIVSDFISTDCDIEILESGYLFQVGIYTSAGVWKGFYRSAGFNWYSGDDLTSIDYATVSALLADCKIRVQLYKTPSASIGTDSYSAISIESKNIYSKEEVDNLLDGYVSKTQDSADAGKVLGIGQGGLVEPVAISTATDKTLSVSNVPADAKATGDSISNVGTKMCEAIGGITSNIPYLWINGGKIKRANTVDITPVADATFCYSVIPCTSGDVFYIKATGDYNYRPYIFVDSTYNLLGGAPNGDPITTITKIVAPTDSAYLILNSLISAEHIVYKNEAIVNKLNRNIATAEHRDSILWESGRINDSGEEKEATNFVRMVSPYWMKAGTHIFAGIDNHFYVLLYNADYTFNSGVASNVVEYVIPSDGLYRIYITGNNISEDTINAYIPTNDLLLFESKQNYNKPENDAINYVATQINPYRISSASIKMAHDSSIVFDNNSLWIAYYCDENTYEESYNNATTYIVIKKCNPYTRETIAETTFKVGDSIGSYTQATKAPYVPKLTVFDDYIRVYFWGYDGSELVISTFKVDKETLALSDYAPCTLEDANGTAHTLNCTGFSAVYASYTGTTITTRTFGFTTQAQYYNGYWYNTLNTVFSGGANTLFIKSADGINWTVDRVMSEVGVANEASFCIYNGYVYVASRSGTAVTRYSLDNTISDYIKVDIPLAISLKTALIIFGGRIILGCNIACNHDASVSNNRKNFGFFEIDPITMNIKLLSRILTQQGMHYPAFAVGNDELWMAWSNDYRFLQRMSQRTNVAVSKIII